jgi:integrase
MSPTKQRRRQLPAGIKERVITRKDGTSYTRYRARYVDPARGGTAQLEQTFPTIKAAQDWLDEQRGDIKAGKHVSPRLSKRPFSSVIAEWRETWQLGPKTRVGYESIIAKHIKPRWGDTQTQAITPAALQKWTNDLAAIKQPNTVLHVHSVMRSALDLAVTRHYIAANPAKAIKPPSKSSRSSGRDRQLYLTAHELRTLVDAMPAPAQWRVPVLTAGLCGLRANELWALTRADVDVLHAQLHVRHAFKDAAGELSVGLPKTYQRRKLSIPSPLLTELERALAVPGVRVRGVTRSPSPTRGAGYWAIVDGELALTDDADSPARLLFTTKGGSPVSHNNFYGRTFKPTADQLWPAGHPLHGFRFHDLRHTCAALSLASTGNLHVVKERLGHTDIRTTINIYGGLLPSVDAALADNLGAMWDATDAPAKSNVLELLERSHS